MQTDDIQDLAREIAARMAPDALLDSEDVAAILKCAPRYVREQYAAAPGFPKAIRLTGADGRRGAPRWRRSDIMQWIDSHEPGVTKRGGRRRNSTDD